MFLNIKNFDLKLEKLEMSYLAMILSQFFYEEFFPVGNLRCELDQQFLKS